MDEKEFEFTLTITGIGLFRKEAWEHAVEQFSLDPGSPPKKVKVVRLTEKQSVKKWRDETGV